ncbi:MAG: hypothetical protein D8M57_12520 [Candidatus Scalindua sp. AMX11]|nr:hypothetical protein [Planctomycetota bacterium]RZV77559.1 MAG: hypothetical protein EX341_11650 [Candidatus Scalindua sp. SCAELEC01]TDE64561.1 MAG: hypothetical protein D8M57_12520 [Candidatus Scalindua sp. AMX11]GJQ58625.1 MAG: hypothetical protein SCALA701_14260 [Candidatus Scalindua sp.]
MAIPEYTVLVQYEFDVYVPLLEKDSNYEVCEITLTKDDFKHPLQMDEAVWKRVDQFRVMYTEVNDVKVPFVKKKRRICGLFDTRPLDWKFANIVIRDEKNNRYGRVMAKMPLSPIIPVVFFVDLKIFNKKVNKDV